MGPMAPMGPWARALGPESADYFSKISEETERRVKNAWICLFDFWWVTSKHFRELYQNHEHRNISTPRKDHTVVGLKIAVSFLPSQKHDARVSGSLTGS